MFINFRKVGTLVLVYFSNNLKSDFDNLNEKILDLQLELSHWKHFCDESKIMKSYT